MDFQVYPVQMKMNWVVGLSYLHIARMMVINMNNIIKETIIDVLNMLTTITIGENHMEFGGLVFRFGETPILEITFSVAQLTS